MGDSKKKWLKFGLGASPALLFILDAIFQPRGESGPSIFFGSIIYLIIGLIVAAFMGDENENKSFKAGVVSGFFASFILSATLCFSSIG